VAGLGRNRYNPNDLGEIVKRLEERVTALETQRRAGNTSIGHGGIFMLRDGTFVMTDGTSLVDPGEKGRISMGHHTANSDEGYHFTVESAVGVAGRYFDGAILTVRTVDGSVTGTAYLPTFELRDKYGGLLVSNTNGTAAGFGHPRLSVNWHDPTAVKTTTSAGFVNVGSLTWYMYHPHLRIQVLVQNGAATVSEVRVRDSDGTEYYKEQFAGSTNQYVGIVIPRTEFESEPTHVNGNTKFLVVEHRRVSGASTAGALITDALGIDLT
jgi:hypothetical protein